MRACTPPGSPSSSPRATRSVAVPRPSAAHASVRAEGVVPNQRRRPRLVHVRVEQALPRRRVAATHPLSDAPIASEKRANICTARNRATEVSTMFARKCMIIHCLVIIRRFRSFNNVTELAKVHRVAVSTSERARYNSQPTAGKNAEVSQHAQTPCWPDRSQATQLLAGSCSSYALMHLLTLERSTHCEREESEYMYCTQPRY